MCTKSIFDSSFSEAKSREIEKYNQLISAVNKPSDEYNGILTRWEKPVLTKDHAPLIWRYDMDCTSNPFFMERLGINAVFNPGSIYIGGTFYLIARVEGVDRKSFLAVAESKSGVDNFTFWDYPVSIPDIYPEETNIYDIRLTAHEDGYIYGVFCSESKDISDNDPAAAIAGAGIVRTKDLKNWERLQNLKTASPQQRNVVLHPEFVNGKYAFYTRPQDSFLEAGSGGGIGFGYCDDITCAEIIGDETVISPRHYHTICEGKNGAGAVPIKTSKGWIHIAHGVRNTAAGLRYVLYAFATALNDPQKVIATPGGYLMAPEGDEMVGDVSNVLFSNGAIVLPDGSLYLYYASSDKRIHVATGTIDRLIDYVFNTPPDAMRSIDCVKQRNRLIEKNLSITN